MAVYLESRCSRCRHAGSKLFLKGERCDSPKCAFERRKYPPGEHGKNLSRSRSSGYKERLIEKQKAKYIYGMLEKPFKNYVEKAKKQKGILGDNILILLERRLDNAVFRAGFASSRRQARQMVAHRIIKLNDVRVSIPSILIKANDKISVIDRYRTNQLKEKVTEHLKVRALPAWMKSQDSWTVSVIDEPSEITPSFDVSRIVEYYSR
ncbi:MAG: 30S ribosomal protein S4 [Epsilonproteobacteria bacterium]|nr:30S ribosomal protein S4 [Campylobacterota bacterium]